MEHPGASKIFRVSHEIIEHGVRRDASVRAQRTQSDIDELEHRSPPNASGELSDERANDMLMFKGGRQVLDPLRSTSSVSR